MDLYKYLRANRHLLRLPISALPFPALSLFAPSFLLSPSSLQSQEPVPSPALFQKPLEAVGCERHRTSLRGGLCVNELTPGRELGWREAQSDPEIQSPCRHHLDGGITNTVALGFYLTVPSPHAIMTETLGMSISEKLPWTSGLSGGRKGWRRMKERGNTLKKKKKQGEKLELGGCRRVDKILRLSCTEI